MAELTTVARPYAKAAFEYANAEGKLELAVWSAQLAKAALLVQDADFARYLSRPSMTVAEQETAFFMVFGDDLSPNVRNFISLVAANKRLTALPVIAELYEVSKADAENTSDVLVTSAYAMTEAQEEVLAKQLANKLGSRIKIRTEVDAALIGGIVVRTGDLVIDASVRGKLAKLTATLNS
jgi:F-type H+-transporting ATPase subunit delta